MDVVKVAGVQMDVVLGEVSRNRGVVVERLEEAAGEGARVVVFPECVVSGYCVDSAEEARGLGESVPGESTELVGGVCARLGCFAVLGLLELGEGGRLFNAAVLVGPDGVRGVYRKAHLPFVGADRFVERGDCPFEVALAGDVRVGMNICYDVTFPEAARALMLDGADLIVLPTNWPAGSEVSARHLVNARALENKVYYAAVNRVGSENGFEFIGCSRICGPSGQVLADAPHRDETILYAEMNLEEARNKHVVRIPGKHELHRYRDRRPDLYGKITAAPKGEGLQGGE